MEYLSAEKLGINNATKDALIDLMGKFQRGEIADKNFHMSEWINHFKGTCGTVCCVGGWLEIHNQDNTYVRNDLYQAKRAARMYNPHPLKDLFYPPNKSPAWTKANTCHGAKAIHNFLTTGDASWDEAMTYQRGESL